MSLCDELLESERRLAAALRRALSSSTPADRNFVADFAVSISSAFVFSFLQVKQYGFECHFSEVAESVGDSVSASLLRLRRGPWGREELFVLARTLRLRLAKGGAIDGRDSSSSAWLPQVSDASLVLAFRRICYDRSRGEIERFWKETHGPGRRLLKALKRHIRQHDGLTIERRSGQRVYSSQSRRSRPAMSRDEIASALPVSALGSPKRLVAALPHVLVPAAWHGGHCYLMDLVHATLIVRSLELQDDPRATGAAPSAAVDVSTNLLIAAARSRVEAKARELLSADAKKPARKGEPQSAGTSDGVTESWALIAAEMVMRRADAGRPDWDGLSQRALINRLIPDARCPEGARRHNQKITYLVSRLRGQLKGVLA